MIILTGEYMYAGDVAINIKYMKAGLGALMCCFAGLDAIRHGYKYAVGCAINPMAKSMYEK